MSSTEDIQALFAKQVIPFAEYSKNVSAKDFAYAVIRDSVLNVLLAPGTRITEKSMAQILNISATPIREAFIRLVQENMLLALPQRGTYVSKIDIQTVRNASYVRGTLERDALKRIDFPLSPELIDEIQAVLRAQDEWLSKNPGSESPVDFLKLDHQFHKLLFTAAELAFVSDIIQQFSLHNHRLHVLTFRFIPDWRLVYNQHMRIADALLAGNRDSLFAMWEEHYAAVEKNIGLVLQKLPDYFET